MRQSWICSPAAGGSSTQCNFRLSICARTFCFVASRWNWIDEITTVSDFRAEGQLASESCAFLFAGLHRNFCESFFQCTSMCAAVWQCVKIMKGHIWPDQLLNWYSTSQLWNPVRTRAGSKVVSLDHFSNNYFWNRLEMRLFRLFLNWLETEIQTPISIRTWQIQSKRS